MDIDALRDSPIGELVPIFGTDPRSMKEWSYWAYLPHDLPAMPTLTPHALALSAKAAAAVARLDEAVAQLPRPEILVRPVIRKEAKSTAALEGTYASFEDVLEADFLEDRQMSSEQREIRNYVEATEAACAEIAERGITRSFLGHLQQMIVKGTPGDTSDAGDIRPHQVAIGPKDRPIEEARFVPCPPGDQLEAGVRAWEQWVASDSDLLIVAKVAIAHYQFETLHPYGDGNGRLGRLVSILQLIKAGELRWPVLNIAPWFESHRDLYQNGLMDVTLTGDFNPWVELFAYAVELQAREGLKKIQELLALRDEMVGELHARGFRGSAIEIAEILIGYPVIDVRTASNLIHKTFEATNVAIAKLVEHGILEEITGRSQNRLFGCYRVAATIAG